VLLSRGRCHHCQGGLLAGEQDEDPLQHHDAAEVERNQHCRQRAVDERAVYDEVYVVEAMAQDGHSDRDRDEEREDEQSGVT
jgi:hypothetical protein